MRRYCLRMWRGNGNIIADIMKDKYYDYPKNSMNKNARAIMLSECIVKVITEDEFLQEMLKISVEHHNNIVKKYNLGSWKLINK